MANSTLKKRSLATRPAIPARSLLAHEVAPTIRPARAYQARPNLARAAARMTWFKVDDKFHSHNKVRKVLADDPAALALWVVAGSWSSDNLTDGFVPDHQLPWLIPTGAAELAQKLVTARLWRRVRGGHEFHEWHTNGDGTKRNPTREEVEEDRRKKAEAGRKGGLARGNGRSKPQSRAKANAQASAKAGASDVLDPPTRPDPTVSSSDEELTQTPPPVDEKIKSGSDDDPAFVAFWDAYPRKVGKGQARRAWGAALKKGADPSLLIKAAAQFRDDPQRAARDIEYTAHPATWLNGERWLDAPTPPRVPTSGAWWNA